MQKTFGHVLAAHKGLGPGFDFLRIALAFTIVFSHSFLLTGNDEFFRSSPLWFAEYALVPMFFALSGFLIAGSAQRLSLKNFLLNRSFFRVAAIIEVNSGYAVFFAKFKTYAVIAVHLLDTSFISRPGRRVVSPCFRASHAIWYFC